MVSHPIHIKRDHYRGANQKQRTKAREYNETASTLEKYINELLLKQTDQIQVYTWHPIARATGIPSDVVAEMGRSIDGGSDGFTAVRADIPNWADATKNEPL